jgi:hypothetical protein
VTEAWGLERISEEVSSWAGVAELPDKFGGLEFRLDQRQIGLLVGRQQCVEILFPRHIRDGLVSSSAAYAQDHVPASDWVTFPITTDDDVQHAIALLRLSYACAVAECYRLALST